MATVMLAHPVKDHFVEKYEESYKDLVAANYLPNGRPPKKKDYVVVIKTFDNFELPGGANRRVFGVRYVLMTYAFFRKHYYWNPQIGETPHSTKHCILKTNV